MSGGTEPNVHDLLAIEAQLAESEIAIINAMSKPVVIPDGTPADAAPRETNFPTTL